MSSITVCVDEVFHNYSPRELSCSVAEVGDDAGPWSYNNAKDAAHYHLLQGPYRQPAGLTTITDLCELVQEWASETGAWDDEERAKWTTLDCLALFLQHLAGDMRAAGVHSTSLSDEPFTSAQCETLNTVNIDSRGEFYYYMAEDGSGLTVEWSAS